MGVIEGFYRILDTDSDRAAETIWGDSMTDEATLIHECQTDEQLREVYAREPYGPSSNSCCKVTRGNTCGSGSLVGVLNGKSLIMTNAHVVGSRPGTVARCFFPFVDRTVEATIIMAAYSDKIMMDWAILQVDGEVDLPHVNLDIETFPDRAYTGGYPSCRGPYFQDLTRHDYLYRGTVVRWRPNCRGGQSGSAVHDHGDHYQAAILTWTWSGFGAGQTARGIWFQYSNQAEIGFARPPGLIELGDNRAEDLESGFFSQTNITSLPIWAHLDDPTPEPDPDDPVCKEFANQTLTSATKQQKLASDLAELAKRYGAGRRDSEDSDNETGPLFGLG